MNEATNRRLKQKVKELGNLPAMPSILNSLGDCLSKDPSKVNMYRVVELISYDESLAGQCLRMANSVLFRRRAETESIRDAVATLGLMRVRDLVYSCSLPKLFSGAKHGLAPKTFWRHALGTALISQRYAQGIAIANQDKLYLAGLLHDMGILVNSLLFPKEFGEVLKSAAASGTPLWEVEQRMLGFTHCESGRILADIWKLPPDISDVIEFHHQTPVDGPAMEITAVVHLADLLCRLRGLGYGYYEAREFDLAAEASWQVLVKKYPAAAQIDLARFTFELDEYALEVHTLVDSIIAGGIK
jgi:HD-like signal output (HDOD) protein